jgi:putative RNA 2'-phosphotransferase
VKSKLVQTSKFLSLVLRHKPDTIGITLSPQGWVDVDGLIEAARLNGHELDRTMLDEVVRSNDKQRFAYSVDGLSIRASQGHSVKVELALKAVQPPAVLFHGTVDKFISGISKHGLLKMQRHHVHLSASEETASNVGSRRGKSVILTIDAVLMASDGHHFYLSDNGVWLVEQVPARYIAGL